MQKEQLKDKADLIDLQLSKLVEDAHTLREEVAKLKDDIAYLTMCEDIDKIFSEIEFASKE